jgi:hypothetical protein
MAGIVLPICGTVLVAVISAALSYYFSAKAQAEQEWRQRKVQHYNELLSAISDLAVDGKDKTKANERFALTAATIALVASQDVVTAVMRFHDEIKESNSKRTLERHDQLLKELLLAMRADLRIKPNDNPSTFEFHLIGTAPKGLADKR